MSTKRIENGCIEIDFDSETGETKSCLIRVNSSILLTTSLLSSQALIVILQRILEGIENHKSNLNILADKQINDVLRRARHEDSFEWKHIDAIRLESGEWKVWLNMGVVSVYLSMEEAIRIVGDSTALIQKLKLKTISPKFFVID